MFAKERRRAPSRIRRAAAAQAAAEAMQLDGLIKAASMLARVPLDDVEPLKRLHRFGADRVREPLRRVLHEGLTGRHLTRLEREVRREAGMTPEANPTNQHAWRLTATAFREDVLLATAGALREMGGAMARPGQFPDVLAFPLDALARMPDGRFVGVRAVGARPGGDPRARNREVLLPALAAARFLDAVSLHFQDPADADRMEAEILPLPASGIAVNGATAARPPSLIPIPVKVGGSGPAMRIPDLGGAVRDCLEELFAELADRTRNPDRIRPIRSC